MPAFTALNTAMFHAEVVAGAEAETDIDLADATPDDVLLMVLYQNAAGVLTADLTSEASIASAGHLRCATTDTSDGKLAVLWLDTTSPEA
ncbi:MAG: hypothetical protein HUU35_18145 [Armatimonadetes bacterium]|nr:hypothetical protein [Armatimonadota bacterium]